MKLSYKIFIAAVLLSFLISYFSSVNDTHGMQDFYWVAGLLNLILAVLAFIVSIFFFIIRKKEIGKNILIASGLLLLAGIAICSIFPMKLRMY